MQTVTSYQTPGLELVEVPDEDPFGEKADGQQDYYQSNDREGKYAKADSNRNTLALFEVAFAE